MYMLWTLFSGHSTPVHSFIYSFIHSFIHSFIQSFIHLFNIVAPFVGLELWGATLITVIPTQIILFYTVLRVVYVIFISEAEYDILSIKKQQNGLFFLINWPVNCEASEISKIQRLCSQGGIKIYILKLYWEVQGSQFKTVSSKVAAVYNIINLKGQ